MWRCPPASGTPFITRPRAKKKPRGPTEESRPKQNLLVYPRTPPHRQVDAILPAASSTLERASELIDAKLKHPLISRDSKGLGERPRLLQQLCKAVDEGPEPVLGHVGDQVVERGALAKQGMGAGLDGVGLEVAVHAEALASGTEQGEQDDGEGVEQQQPVAALRIGDAHRAEAEAQVLGIPEA